MTIDIIVKLQGGDDDATLLLIEKFNPLLKKYAYKLSYDDAYNDLLLNFIELLHNMQIENIHNKSEEGSVVSYICTSVHSSYVKRLIEVKRLRNLLLYSDLNNNELYYVESISATNDVYQEYELSFIKKILTKQELIVISMIYFTGYTVTEIASFSGTSRQAVNQMKNRALKKLRNAFSYKL